MAMALQLPVKAERPLEFEDFTWIPSIIYKSLGYDFLQSPKPRWLQNLMHASIAAIVSSHIICRYYMFDFLMVLIRNGDITNIIRLVTYIIYAIDSNIKFLAFIVNRRRMRKMYEMLWQIYPQTMSERRIYRVNQHYWSRGVKCMICFYFIATWMILLHPLIQSVYNYGQDYLRLGYNETYFAYLKIVPMQYAFDHHTPFKYMVAYTIDTFSCHLATAADMGTDLWLICFTGQICMHLEHIERLLDQYEPTVENSEQDCGFLKELIRRHQFMFDLKNELNSIFGISLLFNLLTTTASMCTVAAQVSVAGLGAEFIKFFSFLVTSCGQFFLVCRCGHQLITTSQNIAVAAFGQRWYTGSVAYKQLLLVLMLRSQKQAELSAKGFQTISLETFKLVMGMTYRVFALLQSVLGNVEVIDE